MALVWGVLSGEPSQQVEVPTTSQGSVRMVATEGGSALPDGSFEGQLLGWSGTFWAPVPNQGSPAARAEGLRNVNDDFPCQLFLGDGFAAITGETAQLNTNNSNVVMNVVQTPAPSWQASFSDGETFTQILGDATTITLTANSPGGTLTFYSHGVQQTMFDGWAVTLGEGADFVGIDLVVGFIAQVESTLEAQIRNEFTQYSLQGDSHVFRNPDAIGTPTNNVQFTSLAGVPAVSFLGAGPVVRQSITGATTQDQVDSIVAALVAFGLVSDDR